MILKTRLKPESSPPYMTINMLHLGIGSNSMLSAFTFLGGVLRDQVLDSTNQSNITQVPRPASSF